MHPALSVIFFTVTSGAGYGLLLLLGSARLSGIAPEISSNQTLFAGIVGLVLVTLGLLSSTLHLANPKNAWRSFARFKTSWLSREAVFAILFYPICLVWLAVVWAVGNSTLSLVLGLFVAVMSIVILVCTAMIYASLKTIRQWNNPLTTVNFILLGLLLGSLILLLMLHQQNIVVSRLIVISVFLISLSALTKIIYFVWIGQPAGPTINTALGFTRATVRILDVGHSSDTFLNKEFGYEVARARLIWLRCLCVLLAFVVPAFLVSGVIGEVGFIHLIAAAFSAYVGVFVERWLFFAEARHVVNLYHGRQQT